MILSFAFVFSELEPGRSSCSAPSCSFFSSFSTSLIAVAPSASMNSTFLPREHMMPAFTAYPLPLLDRRVSSRTASTPCFFTYSNATSDVESVLPSSTTMTSYVNAGRLARRRWRYHMVSSSVAGSRSSSL